MVSLKRVWLDTHSLEWIHDSPDIDAAIKYLQYIWPEEPRANIVMIFDDENNDELVATISCGRHAREMIITILQPPIRVLVCDTKRIRMCDDPITSATQIECQTTTLSMPKAIGYNSQIIEEESII